MNAGKRLVQYALTVKGMIIAALVMLSLSVSAELAGPFIAKRMIDQHIIGIEQPWYETEGREGAVLYDGAWYKRGDRFTAGETKGKTAHVLQIERSYYFIEGGIAFDGKRLVDDGVVSIQNGDAVQIYKGEKLTANELFRFYEPEIPYLLWLSIGYILLLAVASIFAYGQKFYLQKASNKIIQTMREDVFAHIQRIPIGYFDRLPAGKIVSRVTNDTEAIRELYVTVLATFFSGIIYIAGIFIALFLLDAKLAVICLIIVPILYVWAAFYRKYASKYNHEIRSRLSDINGTINESIQGMPIIQAFRQQRHVRQEFEHVNGEYYEYQTKLLSLNAATSHNLVGVLRNLAFVAVILYFGGGALTAGTAISIGVLYAFVDYLTRLFSPITGIVNQLGNLEQARVASERVFELLDERGTDVSAERLPRFRGDVVFEDVSFAYNGTDYVLKDISFEAKRGETVALVGHTGSGKSSIMNVLFGFYEFQQGDVRIDGMSVKELPKQTVREHMGIVLQDPFLFTGTIGSNVSLGSETMSKERIEAALRNVGADRFLSGKGLEEPVIEKGSTLSAGERQLVSFARALAFNPAILILDEATSSVDTETEAVIQHALDVLKQGRTTFIIAHRLSTIKNANQILVLDRGEIVERGTHDELMRKQGKYYRMYETQAASGQ